MRDITPATRLRQGAALLAGALLAALVLPIGGAQFHWVPAMVGVAYLLGALASGKHGSYWATAVPLLGWGIAVGWFYNSRPDVDVTAVQLIGMGAGVLAAALLARRGWAVDPVGVGATVIAAGVFLALQRHVELIREPWLYVALIAAVGAVNVAIGLAGRR